jgi:hypothetical protein
MRYGCAALLMLISSVMASAQEQVRVTAPAPTVELVDSLNSLALLNKKLEVRVSPEEVVARLMSFDRNGDGKVAINELSERMQGLVARADRSADGALDAAEIRAFSESPQSSQTAFRNLQGGGYGFGDTGALSTRSHIENTLEDLRLTPQVNEQARLIGSAFADELENTARASLKKAVAPMLTETQLAEFESNIKRGVGTRRVSFTDGNGVPPQMQTLLVTAETNSLLRKYQLTSEQMKTATAAVETFKAAQQLDDASRSALVARLSDVLSSEESDNFRAALARRPLVKGLGAFTFQATVETTRVAFPGNGAPVREIGFSTAVPAVLISR